MEKRFVELDLTDLEKVEKFRKFYDEVFSKSFPRDEIGEFEAYIDIKKNAIEGVYDYNIAFIEVDGEYVAIYIFLRLPRLGVVIGEFCCVAESFRGKNLSTELMDWAGTRYPCAYLFGEVERDNVRNLAIWKRYGFEKVPVGYKQLPLSETRSRVDKLCLCVKPKHKALSIPSSLIKKVIYMYYKYSQFCPVPENQPEYLDLVAECDKAKEIELQPLC